MNETILENPAKRVKFPVAGILLLISAFGSMVQLADTLRRLAPVISQQPSILTSQLLVLLRLLLVVFLAVVLLMKKRGGLMLGALSALWVWDTILRLSPLLAGRSNLMITSAAFFLLSAAATVFSAIFSAKMLLHETEPSAEKFRKLWFLPAILFTLAAFYDFVQCLLLGYPAYSLVMSMLSAIFNAITLFLLFRWLACPYVQTVLPAGQAAYAAPASESPAGTGYDAAQSPQRAPAPSLAFCPVCGAKLIENAAFCSGCGNRVSPTSALPVQPAVNRQATPNPSDASSGGYAVLGFFVPMVGLILYLIWKDTFPLRAKSAGKGALAGAITWTALVVLTYMVYFIWVGSLFAGLY